MNGILLALLQFVGTLLALFYAPSILIRLKWTWTLFARRSRPIPGTKWYHWRPIVGDGLQFLRDPETFWDVQRARYGKTFLTNLFGRPIIMTSAPDVVKFVLQTHYHLFSPSYPMSMDMILNGTAPWEGEFHLRMRKVLQAPLLNESLKANMDSFDSLARWTINAWKETSGAINVHEETRKYSLHVALAATCSVQPNDTTMTLLDKYTVIGEGLTSLPLNIPGFAFHKAMQAKTEIVAEMQRIVDMRRLKRRVSSVRFNDILDSFLTENSRERGQHFSDTEMRISLFIVLIAGHESTATLLAWVVKFLTDNQDILQQVKEEQDAVRASKGSAEEPLTWADTKRMPLTCRVIQESLRLGNPVPLTPRIALHDIEYNGTVYPKNWQIFCNYRNVHMDPELYPNPTKFDPDRFLQPPKPFTFMPFGGGSRYCLGSELVKVEALIFLHYMVTTYSWERYGPDRGVQYWPSPRPKGGYPILVRRYAGSSCEPPTHTAAGEALQYP